MNVISSGVMKDFSRATREPFMNVYFCGTETATSWMGYMDGAVESGERVVNEVLHDLFGINSKIKVDYEKTFYAQQENVRQPNQIDSNKLKSKILLSTVLSGASMMLFLKFKDWFIFRLISNWLRQRATRNLNLDELGA